MAPKLWKFTEKYENLFFYLLFRELHEKHGTLPKTMDLK